MQEIKKRNSYQNEITRLLKRIISNYQPERIFAFGSTATGNINENSDIDLLVIKKTRKKFWDRVKEVLKLYDGYRSFDVSVLTPEEIGKAKEKGWYFITEEILKNGKLLYEKS